jgi:superfamily II DNA or RNA helicase
VTDRYKDYYVPEMDGGKNLSPGVAVFSARVWIPKSMVPNKDAMMSAARIERTDNAGEVISIMLAEEVGDYIVLNRHLFEKWQVPLEVIIPPPVPHKFYDRIKPKNQLQEQAWEALKNADNGVLNLACGKGKTVLGLKKIAHVGMHSLVIVPSAGLISQWVTEAQKLLALGSDDIGVVRGAVEQWDRPLVIASLSTVVRRDLSFETLFRFGIVIFDECHNMAATTFSSAGSMFYGMRIGLTATAEREDGLEPVYYSNLGGIFYSDLTQELPAEVEIHRFATEPPEDESVICDRSGAVNIPLLRAWLANNSGRNRNIIRLLEKLVIRGRKIAVLTHSVEHTEILMNESNGSSILSKKSRDIVTGATKPHLRRDKVQDACITFATVNVLAEGLDVRSLDTVVFITPLTSWRQFAQGKGRAEREFTGKQTPLCIVVQDVKIQPANSMVKKLIGKVRTKLGIRPKVVG